jgi:arylsulfatase A-like enzyme
MTRRKFLRAGAVGITGSITVASETIRKIPSPSVSSPLSTNDPSAAWAHRRIESPPDQHERIRAQNRALRAQDPRPNILLIYTDQQTYRALSATGNPWLRTPHMDMLARHGVNFSRSYCPAPICGPSRGSLVYGRLPHETGVRYNGESPAGDMPNLGTALRAVGYDTTWIGKWHLPESYPQSSEIPGFHYLSHPAETLGSFLGDAVDMHCAMQASYYLRWHAALAASPWFLGLSLHNPHDICHYFIDNGHITSCPEPDPANIDSRYLPPLPENHAANPAEAEFLLNRRKQTRYGAETGNYGTDLTDAHWRAYLKTYYSLTETVDRCLAPVLQGLAQGGWLNNTVIFFTSDHGEGMAAHQWFTKLTLYEETLRVPFIAVPAGALGHAAGRTIEHHLVSGLDLMPTCLDYAGIADQDYPANLRGRSLRPLIESSPVSPGTSWRQYLVVPIDLSPERPGEVGRALITADGWKYHVYSGGRNPEALYNLTIDPGETHNLVAIEPDQRQRCLALLEDHCQTSGDPFMLQTVSASQ